MKVRYLFVILTILWKNDLLIQCRGVNGGMSCAVCTVLMGIVMQLAEINEENIANATKKLCHYLPNNVQTECLKISEEMEKILGDISPEITPDVFCFLYATCTVDVGQPLCHLFPLPFEDSTRLQSIRERNQIGLRIDVCNLPVIKDICDILNNSYTTLDAAEDFDQDGFSVISPARGADWKGRDCNDNDINAHPGRRPLSFDSYEDSNCNGIWGINNKTNVSWEEELCAKSEPRGIIFIGDSISAHFHMPQVWINPVKFDWPSLNITNVILDELDWPQYGYATGFKHIEPNILIKGTTDSLYLRLRKRNRCNHRDYQNLSQNGASSIEGVEHVKAVSRNQSTDYPALVFYAMQGNDVCNNFRDTLSNTTPPHVFRNKVMKVLQILDKKLPPGSHVIIIGLVNADFIFDAMAKRLHPIGYLHKDVYYEDVYNWFNCMQIGPCTGWLNSNKTLRELTTLKSLQLNEVLEEITRIKKFQHFQLHYMSNPINMAMNARKINIPDFLESVDSLHPNQRAQPMLAETIWNFMENNLPKDVLGSINKNNKLIKTLFGNQGGH